MGKNCRNPKEGHINNATITNTQNGCNLIFAPFHQRLERGGRGGRGRDGRDGGRGRGRGPPVITGTPLTPVVPVIE
jgi:hypothetical protein